MSGAAEKESLLPRLPSSGEAKSYYFLAKTKSQVCNDPICLTRMNFTLKIILFRLILYRLDESLIEMEPQRSK